MGPGMGAEPILAHGAFQKCQVTTGQALASVVTPLWSGPPSLLGPPGTDTGQPAVVVNPCGKGRVVWINGELFSGYFHKNNPLLKDLVRCLVDRVLPDKFVHADAPPSVEITCFRKEHRLFIHLVNVHAEKAAHGPWYAETAPTIRDLSVRVRPPKPVRRWRAPVRG